jgi:hypothetical protein
MATPMEEFDSGRLASATQTQSSPSQSQHMVNPREPATPDELVGDSDEVLEQPGGELNLDDFDDAD